MPFDFILIPCREDNYAVLLGDPTSGTAVLIDAPEAEPIKLELGRRNWRLTHILITHHHYDHVEGLAALKESTGASVIAPAKEAGRIPAVDMPVEDGSRLSFADHEIQILATPGHTLGHVSYYFPSEEAIFVGDTLFVLGCGRLIEGSADMMWSSLQKLAALPEKTKVYCGHEYALSNAQFALTAEPENAALQKRMQEIQIAREAGQFVMPTTIGLERETNPFLRAADINEFAALRARKDNFKSRTTPARR